MVTRTRLRKVFHYVPILQIFILINKVRRIQTLFLLPKLACQNDRQSKKLTRQFNNLAGALSVHWPLFRAPEIMSLKYNWYENRLISLSHPRRLPIAIIGNYRVNNFWLLPRKPANKDSSIPQWSTFYKCRE